MDTDLSMDLKLDLKDKKILYHLDINARQGNAEIAKKVRLSKDAVGYRIKRLEEQRIIRGYITTIDSSKLGYLFYRIFFKLMDMQPDQLESLIEFLKAQKNVWWIAKLDGAWDFAFSTWVISSVEFRKFYNQLCLKFKKFIKDRLICPITAYKQMNRSYLLGTENAKKVESVGGGSKADYDHKDIDILKILSKNARAPLIEIAHKLKVDSMTVYHRIKKLQKKGIIQGYHADLNFNLLKRDFYCVKINLKDISKIKEMEKYVKTLPETTAVIEAVGSYDFEFDIEVHSSKQYFKIIEELESRFDFIREITYFRVLKNYKILYMPEI